MCTHNITQSFLQLQLFFSEPQPGPSLWLLTSTDMAMKVKSLAMLSLICCGTAALVARMSQANFQGWFGVGEYT